MSAPLNGKICTVVRECTASDFESAILRSRDDSDLMEFRLDYLDSAQLSRGLMERWVSMAQVPVIATLRRKPFGGQFAGDGAEQLEVLGRIRGAGCSYLDVEVETLEVAGSGRLRAVRDESCRLIGSYHNFKETPKDLEPIFRRILAVNADVVKIATLASCFGDNLRLLDLISLARDHDRSVIAVAMGELGAYSRLLAPSRGALLTYASTRTGQETAPGQLTSRDLKCVYRLNAIDRDTVLYGVIGYPIGHSLSPRIHNFAFQTLGMNCRYLPLPTPDLEALAPHLGCFAGLSVTIPHKIAVLKHVQVRDESVDRSGAANTLVRGDGDLRAYNTDLDGIRHALRHCLALSPRTVVLLGAGGAARAAAAVLHQARCHVMVLARNRSKAERLARDFGFDADSLDRVGRYRGDLLINATPVGMSPRNQENPVPGAGSDYGTVFDMVYNPLETRLLREARGKTRVVSGLEMFMGQAARQFCLWTGRQAPLEGMRTVALEQLSSG